VVLEKLGFDASFEAAFEALGREDLVPGRVAAGHTRLRRVLTERGELLAGVSGRLRHAAAGPEALPAVGDWVALSPLSRGDRGTIHAILPRRSAFVRKAAGTKGHAQILAANVDTAFLVMGLDGDYNPRRIERALVLAWESRASPVVLLNKADVCDDTPQRLAEVEAAAPGVPIHVLSARLGQGLETLVPYLAPGLTAVLLGSSGVGKSTIVNQLLGEERQPISEVRADDQRGRHTTTYRELIVLPGGGLLIDTPGLRELQLWSTGEGLNAAFDDVARLGEGCRFRDCRHEAEPGCAVRGAVEAGELSEERLASYHKLQTEVRHLDARADLGLQRLEKSRWRSIQKAARSHRPRE